MNKRIGMMIVVAVAVLLPAVAVAEVMVQGNIDVSAALTTSTIQVHEGPNYIGVYGVEDSSFASVANSAGEIIGKLDPQSISNETAWAINFLYITFSTTYTGPGWFNVSVSGSGFSSSPGAAPVLYFLVGSPSSMTFSDITSSPLPSDVYALPLTDNSAISIHFTSVPSSIDIGMYIPAGISADTEANIAMLFTTQ